MKKILLCTAIFACITCFSQDCKNYLYMTNNAEVQKTMYDKNGSATGIITWKISDVKKQGNDFISNVTATITDEKGKGNGQSSSGVYRCSGGVLKADIKMSIPQQQMQNYKPTDVKLEPVYIEYPYDLSVGQTLKDANFNMDMSMNGGLGAKLTFNETNRKVEAKEKVSTPAGSWDAYKITYDAFLKIQLGIGIPIKTVVKEWFVPGEGIVKTETYDKKGKLMGSTMVTFIKK